MNNWTIYILRCKNNSLYTGITKNIEQRIKKHNLGIGAKYTNAHKPCVLIWSKSGYSESSAKKEEYRIKKLTRIAKENYIKNSTR